MTCRPINARTTPKIAPRRRHLQTDGVTKAMLKVRRVIKDIEDGIQAGLSHLGASADQLNRCMHKPKPIGGAIFCPIGLANSQCPESTKQP